MPETPGTPQPPCRHCGAPETIANGRSRGHPRWLCRACGRTFGRTTGTPLAGLKTPPDEIARALLIVLRRGSLRAAEEITGHKYETVGAWLERAGQHAEALTDVLVHDLALSEVEADEFWSFVRTKGDRTARKRGQPVGSRTSPRPTSPPKRHRTNRPGPPRANPAQRPRALRPRPPLRPPAERAGAPSRSPGAAGSSSPGPPAPATSDWPPR